MEDKESRILYEKAYDELLRRCNGEEFFMSGPYYGDIMSLAVWIKRPSGSKDHAFVGSDCLPWRPCLRESSGQLGNRQMDWKERVVKTILEVAKEWNVFVLASSFISTKDLVIMKKGESLESLLVWADLMDGNEQDGR